MGQPDNNQPNQQTGQPGGQCGSPQELGQQDGKQSNQQTGQQGKQSGEQTPEFDETHNRQNGTADQTDASWRPGEAPVGQDTEGDLGGGQGDQQRSVGASGTNE